MYEEKYISAGVNISLNNHVKSSIGHLLKSTHHSEVISELGGFSALFSPNLAGRKINDPIFVSSMDGVGTKLKIAFLANKHDSIGQDLLYHCVNDIAVTGAKPLFFLDYIAGNNLQLDVCYQIIEGLTKACLEVNCALIGGETAQMPDIYHLNEYDVAGTIIGIVDRSNLIDKKNVTAGDMIIGLASNGLHTNGYSLVRKVLFEQMDLKISDTHPLLSTSLSDELLKIHRNYLPEFNLINQYFPNALKAAAHITGGGMIDNIPRVINSCYNAKIYSDTWIIPPIFNLIQSGGNIAPHEMYHVFNMGIGMILIVRKEDADNIAKLVNGNIIGTITDGTGVVQIDNLLSNN